MKVNSCRQSLFAIVDSSDLRYAFRRMKTVIVGTGYVGLVSGLGYASIGHRVTCVDTNAARIGKLQLGEAPFYEFGLSQLLQDRQQEDRIRFTTELKDALAETDVILLAVGTPAAPTGEADLRSLFMAADQIGAYLDHEALVVVKSTVPVGTCQKVLERVRAAMEASQHTDAAETIQIASAPEFLSEGKAIEGFFHPARLVFGTDDPVARATLEHLHEGIPGPRVWTTLESSELIKYTANAFLATKIAFINEIANVCERVGADVRVVAKALGLDPRIGPAFLQAGVGYGGSCFPKDVSALYQIAGSNGYEFKVLSAVIEANNRQRDLFFKKAETVLGGWKGRAVAVWGLAFKGGTDDVRESIAIDLIQRMDARGAEVTVYDPLAMENARPFFSDRVTFAPTAVDAVSGAEILFVLTDCPEFREVSFEAVRENMLSPVIFDGRNYLCHLPLSSHGFAYYGVGARG
ncbi:MAG TPA: UDP-glucose/GDP-mannose dehydrogenase family protein [Patescibacteria group bacterium]|nr:UDP-glucose/GDP-mannose dehydrogenase family protein [Patescibacteria group bacterium]